jgi:Sulfatase
VKRLTPASVALVIAFSVAPYTGFLADNRGEITGARQIVLLAVVTAVVSLAALVGALLARPTLSADRAAVVIAVVLVGFFNYYRVFDTSPPVTKPALQLVLWLVLVGALAVLGWRLSDYAPVRSFLLLLGIFLCVIGAITYLSGAPEPSASSPPPTTPPSGPPHPETAPSTGDLPNVYFFLLDEHARSDQLAAEVGLDNSDFLAGLEADGFAIGDQAFTSYPKTLLSIPSILDMNYLADPDTDLPGGILEFENQLKGDNETVRRLRDLGYTYVYSDNGNFEFSACDDLADVCIESERRGVALTETQLTLLRTTPIGALDLKAERVTDPVYVLDQVAEKSADIPEPFFLFAHILSPHGPARYEQDCSLRDTFVFPSSPKTDVDRHDYAQDVRCLDALVLEAADRIRHDDPDAIVVFLSDHGSYFSSQGATQALDQWSDEGLRETFGAFEAIRLPDRCEGPPQSPHTIVNTFRYVLACIDGSPVEPVDDRAFVWVSATNDIEEVDDATDRFGRAG